MAIAAIVAIVAILLLSACTVASSARSQPAISTAATIESSPLSAHFELTSTDVVRGGLASATIVIGNLTGQEIVTSVCGPFVAGLTKMGEPLSLPVLTCAGRYVIPIGETRLVVKYSTRVSSGCSTDPNPKIPLCGPDGPPLLSTGDYELKAAPVAPEIPVPSPVLIRLVD
ncbi:MAG: hypothetical protein WCJ88_03890 [Actinomycetes bacterium]